MFHNRHFNDNDLTLKLSQFLKERYKAMMLSYSHLNIKYKLNLDIKSYETPKDKNTMSQLFLVRLTRMFTQMIVYTCLLIINR